METFILMALAVPLVTAVAVFGRRKATSSWREAAKLLGLSMRPDKSGHALLEGKVGSAKVVVDTVDHVRERKTITWTRVCARGDIPPSLLVGGDGFWSRWNEEHGHESVELAGVAFDDHVIARGRIPEIFGLLSADTRAQFRAFEKDYRAFVMDGAVQVEQQGLTREPEELAKLVRGVARLAMALSLQGPSLADRLGANVVTDANALVRLRNLEVLLDKYPKTASAQLACEHAMGDRSYGVSLLAAQQCGAEGLATVERILRDDKASLALRLQSMAHLAELLVPEEAVALLVELVETSEQLRPAAVVELASMGLDPGVEVMLELLLLGRPEGWIAFARAITALERRDLRGPLEALLDEDATGDTLEFTLGPRIPAEEAIPVEDEGTDEATEQSADGELIIIEIPADLRVDLEVQRAAEEALRTLQIRGVAEQEAMDEELTPDPSEEPDEAEAPEFGGFEQLDEAHQGGPSMASEEVRFDDLSSEVELEAHAE